MTKKRALVTGASGFIGGHLCHYLRERGFWVRGVDYVAPRYRELVINSGYHKTENILDVDEFKILDLRDPKACLEATKDIQEVWQLAADMGGMGFISANHSKILHNNSLININMIESSRINQVERYLYTSSACVYPEYKQELATVTALKEEDAWPAHPQDAYGLEKLCAERLCYYYALDYKMTIRIARFHNIFGPYGSWNDGREKAPAAAMRKVAEAKLQNSWNPQVIIWGDGKATRSFCYIDDALKGLDLLMYSDFQEPLNIGRSEMVTVDQLHEIAANVANINIEKVYDLYKPQGVRGRNSDNTLCKRVLGWEPEISLEEGIRKTYPWIEEKVRASLV